MSRPRRRFLLFVTFVIVAIAGFAAPAFAHAQLESTDPASGSVLSKSPGTVVLRFGEDVEIQLGAVKVYDSTSRRIDTANAYHPNGDGHAVAIKVASSLRSGGYVVTWRVISADSHPVHGAYTFLIGSGGADAATAANNQAARLLATTSGSRTVGVVFGVVRFLAFASLFVLVGGAAFLAGAWTEGRMDRRAQWLIRAALTAAIVTTALSIPIQAPYGGGLPLSRMLSPTDVNAVIRTRFGEVYLVRLVILLLGAAPLVRRLLEPEPLPRRWPVVGAVVGGAVLITPGLAGHAATGSLVALAVPFDVVHLAAASVWVGGLTVLAVAVLVPGTDREKPNPLTTVLPRYSQWALGAVLAIAVSGGFAAWRQIGSLSAVTTTPYGRLVLAKTVIFVVLVAVATRSRRLVHGHLNVPFGLSPPPRHRAPAATAATTRPPTGTPTAGATASPAPEALAPPHKTPPARTNRAGAPTRPTRRRNRAQRLADLRTAVWVELLLAAAIIGVTAVLVNAQPARQALNQPFSTEVHAGPNVLVDVVVDPARQGPVAIHLYTLSAAGAQIDVPEVDAVLSLPSAGITNLAVPLQHGGTGHFLVGGFQVPLRGTWTLSITVRTTNFDEFNATPVRVHFR